MRLASKDQRGGTRYEVNGGASCSFAMPVVEDPGPAKVKEVSMNAVGLFLERRVEVGSLLAVGLANPAKGFARTVLVRVTQVTAGTSGYAVGGQFLTPLSYQEMTALVL
jgi:hypothetical protein